MPAFAGMTEKKFGKRAGLSAKFLKGLQKYGEDIAGEQECEARADGRS
jgi:hypothetical protein